MRRSVPNGSETDGSETDQDGESDGMAGLTGGRRPRGASDRRPRRSSTGAWALAVAAAATGLISGAGPAAGTGQSGLTTTGPAGAVAPPSPAAADPLPPSIEQQVANSDFELDQSERDALAARARLADTRARLAVAEQTATAAARQWHAALVQAGDQKRALALAASGVVRLQREVDELDQHVRKNRNAVGEAVHLSYVAAPASSLEAFATATDPSRLIDGLGLLDRVVATRRARLVAARSTRSALDERGTVLARAQGQLTAATRSAQAKEREAQALYGRQRDASSDVARLERDQAGLADEAQAALVFARQRQQQISAESDALSEMLRERAARANHAGLPAGPSSWATGPRPSGGELLWPVDGTLSSRFGYRLDPILGGRKLHTGLDIGALNGSPVFSAAEGIVTWAGPSGGYGNFVCIARDSVLTTCYAHLSAIRVREGQWADTGAVVGLVGSTGMSTGPHLHFEVRLRGTPVDPLPSLR